MTKKGNSAMKPNRQKRNSMDSRKIENSKVHKGPTTSSRIISLPFIHPVNLAPPSGHTMPSIPQPSQQGVIHTHKPPCNTYKSPTTGSSHTGGSRHRHGNSEQKSFQTHFTAHDNRRSKRQSIGSVTVNSEKLVATVAPTTTLPQLGGSDNRNTSNKITADNSNALPKLRETQDTPGGRSGGPSRGEGKIKIDQDGNKLPLTPQDALKLYKDRLTVFEQTEILDYPEIWYLGLECKKVEGSQGASQNNGYDDEQGSYIKVYGDHLVYRYEILDLLGKGSFGQVVKAHDHKTDQQVAIKLIRNKKRFHHQALVEVKILDALRRKDKDNQHQIIHMGEYFYFRNHLCITFELMGMNLYELIKKNNFQGFSLALIRRFAYSLLQCLKVLHKDKIIHCDLKPENILLRQRGQSSIKVIDFGSSCYEHQRVYTYIQSRFYRSPEVILGMSYSMPIDMWSFGCILSELYTGYPLFPGENEVEQLSCIMEVLGMPSPEILETSSRKRLFFDSKGSPRCITNSKGKKRRPGSKDLAQAIRTSDAHFLDFVKRCLEWDPSKRMTPDEALQHDWIREGLVQKPAKDSKSRQRRDPEESKPAVTSQHPDPYKTAAQPPVKEKTRTEEWKLSMRKQSAKHKERLQPIGADNPTTHEEYSQVSTQNTGCNKKYSSDSTKHDSHNSYTATQHSQNMDSDSANRLPPIKKLS
ncbi:unnamed protein product [Owenia fusiformis]|uniref:dual-specificity kinase n=1 Tax=Owenia fusiformis TaxID=6347 RepID=A0A8S4N147_OWEFU|nr:unnamed protein product [Owenia fusiformis]